MTPETPRQEWARRFPPDIFVAPKNPLAHIAQKFHWQCHYCGKDVTPHKHSNTCWDDYATVDHVIARANGGTNEDSNKVLACHFCNSRKGAR